MIKSFKTLLLKIVKLPLSDQKWLLEQLAPRQKELFHELNGPSLLKEAQVFKTINSCELIDKSEEAILPNLCDTLRQEIPLFIAIILEQNQYSWENAFLEYHPQKEDIKQIRNEVVIHLKTATKLRLVNSWHSKLSFNEQLESMNG